MNWVLSILLLLVLLNTYAFAMQPIIPIANPALVQELLSECTNKIEFQLNPNYLLYREEDFEYKAIALAEVIKANTTLTKLDLDSCRIGNNGATALAKALESNSTVQHLNLCFNEIGYEGAYALAMMLQSNKTITRFYIGHNPMGPLGGNAIFSALTNPSALQTLMLFRIKDIDLTQLNEAISNNCSLRHLHLGGNPLSQQNAIALFNSLAKNTRLETLDIRHIQLDDVCLDHLVRLIRHTKTIKNLDIFGCGLKDQHVSDLMVALRSNLSLVKVNSSPPSVHDPALALMRGLQERNKNFQKLLPKMMIFMTGYIDAKSNLSRLPKELIMLLLEIFFDVASEKTDSSS